MFLNLFLLFVLQKERGMVVGWRFPKVGYLRGQDRSTILIFSLSPQMIIFQKQGIVRLVYQGLMSEKRAVPISVPVLPTPTKPFPKYLMKLQFYTLWWWYFCRKEKQTPDYLNYPLTSVFLCSQWREGSSQWRGAERAMKLF